MKNGNIGIALLLFAILLRLCSSGLDVAALIIGVVGLLVTLFER